MGGAPFIPFWCAAVRRPQVWSAGCSGALVLARPSAATPAGAGGWGRRGAWCAGQAASPAPRVAVPSGGGGASPRLQGGRRVALVAPKLGGGAGEGSGGAAPPPPRPVGRRPAIRCLRRAPPGVYSCRGGCRAAAGVGRGPVGCQWVSAAEVGGAKGGEPPRPGSRPRLPRAGL